MAEPVRLVPLPAAALDALLSGDLATASSIAGVELPPWFSSDDTTWLWRLRAAQITEHPDAAHWTARAAVTNAGVVVGHAGFHGPPDAAGLVEIGYSVDPDRRRRGHARALLRELLDWAAAEPDVVTVRATISPDNVASLATIAGFDFVAVGEQWDEEDGLETIFERPAHGGAARGIGTPENPSVP